MRLPGYSLFVILVARRGGWIVALRLVNFIILLPAICSAAICP